MIKETPGAGLGGVGVMFYVLVVVNTFYNYLLSCAKNAVLKSSLKRDILFLDINRHSNVRLFLDLEAIFSR